MFNQLKRKEISNSLNLRHYKLSSYTNTSITFFERKFDGTREIIKYYRKTLGTDKDKLSSSRVFKNLPNTLM